jgi:hypothetical protein
MCEDKRGKKKGERRAEKDRKSKGEEKRKREMMDPKGRKEK